MCWIRWLTEVGAPQFIRIDFENKSVTGPERTTPILLQGKELEYAWGMALDQVTGHFSATLTNYEGAFVLFGACTPL